MLQRLPATLPGVTSVHDDGSARAVVSNGIPWSGALRLWLMQAVMLSVCTTIPTTLYADAALDDYNVAVQFYKQSRWMLAADGFRDFLKKHPQHDRVPFARLYLGLTQVNQSDFPGGRETLRAFVKEYPQNQNLPQARYRIAECSYLLNDLPAARSELRVFLREHPDDALGERAWAYLGDVELRQNDAQAAAEAFEQSVKKYPKGVLIDDAEFGWAKALDALKQPELALAKFQQLAKGDGPRAADAVFQLANREFDAGRFDVAAKAYQDLARRFPQSRLLADAHLNAGFALYRTEDFSASSREFSEAARDPGRFVQAKYWEGLSRKSEGDYDAAIAAFTAAAEKSPMDPLMDAILFQRGMCERAKGEISEARATLAAVVDRFPKAEHADDALHFAAELALEAGDLAEARTRLDQFQKAYPESGLRLYQELLRGRLELALATQPGSDGKPLSDTQVAGHHAAAAARFQQVMTASTLPRTRNQARYYLGLTKQLAGDHAEAVTLLEPLVEQIRMGSVAAELSDAMVLLAESQLQLQHFPAASALADEYLKNHAQARQAPRALAIAAIAKAQDGKMDEARRQVARLEAEHPSQLVTSATLLRLGQLADEQKDWTASIDLYGRLRKVAAGTDQEPFAMRGIAWAELQSKRYSESRDLFLAIERDFPKSILAPEAAYYAAEVLREQGMSVQASPEFQRVFQKYAPAEPAPAGAETRGAERYAYAAGLLAARSARQGGQWDVAAQAYENLLAKFPKVPALDRLLDEWALMHYEAEQFDQADDVFRRLIRDVPESELADNARLSLAESDLIAGRLEAAKTAFSELKASSKSDPQVRERASYQLVVLALEQRDWPTVKLQGSEFRKTFPESESGPYIEYALLEAAFADPAMRPEAFEMPLARLEQMRSQPPANSDAWSPRLWVLTAEAQYRLKRYEAVQATVDEFRERFPKSTLAYQLDEILGRSLKQQAKFPEARTILERVLADPSAFRTETAAKSQLLIAETYFLEEKWKEALIAYQKVYASYAYPEWQSAALLQSGQCDEQLGNWRDAAATYERLLKEFPKTSAVTEATRRLELAKARIKA